ncbi:MAG TPA: PTS sugar transporter subunit IIA [Feifaniaceae bacterium]|nr:PTS sugar transporter subunit IIA [Feifaniaceae bacterium]
MREQVPFADKVREDLVLLGVEGETRDEVLYNIAKVLMEKGVAKDTFYEALLQRENEYPTGLPIGEINLAIPHTYPEHINEVAVTIAIPRKPVVFRNMGDRDEEISVSVILCLTMRKMDDNVKLLPALMGFFANEDNLRALLACKTRAEVISLVTA